MDSDERHSELVGKLDTLIKIQSLSAVSHLTTNKDKILFLSEAGLAPKEIAGVVGTTAASVSQTVYAANKAKK